jgi:hypothetical protein
VRYYEINISDPATGVVLAPSDDPKWGFVPATEIHSNQTFTFSSLLPGKTKADDFGHNPGALQVEVDLPLTVYHLPAAKANPFVRISGVSLSTINQAAQIVGKNVSIYGGFSKGLPLAHYDQAGLLTAGTVRQAIGNRIGNETSLSIYLQPSASPGANRTSGQATNPNTLPVPDTPDRPAPIIFQWSEGEPFPFAVQKALSVAFPKYQIKINVSPNLVWTGATTTGYFATLTAFAQSINMMTRQILGGNLPDVTRYAGVSIVVRAGTIEIEDGTSQKTTRLLDFYDLVGNPTYNEPERVQIVTAMRADINVNDYIRLPSTARQIVNPGSAINLYKGTTATSSDGDALIFHGTFRVDRLRHIGNSRDPNMQSWVTTFDCGLVRPGPNDTNLSTLFGPSSTYLYALPK